MLGEVLSDKENKSVKKIKVGDFGMGVYPKTGYSPDESEVFEVHYGTPKRSLTTARLRAHLGSFRINVSVVCPNPEKSKRRLALTRRETDDITQAMRNLVKMLVKHALGEDFPA
mgnify:CR=1 FL=1